MVSLRGDVISTTSVDLPCRIPQSRAADRCETAAPAPPCRHQILLPGGRDSIEDVHRRLPRYEKPTRDPFLDHSIRETVLPKLLPCQGTKLPLGSLPRQTFCFFGCSTTAAVAHRPKKADVTHERCGGGHRWGDLPGGGP